MAIKAGLVGVNPKGVDKNGMPISSGGGSVDAYTKAETNALLAGKVNNSQLTANNKAFHFAYDATSGKYGYKLNGTGEFIPFESAGGDGWVTPADLITTGITYNRCEYVEGGYKENDGVVYIDIIVSATYTGSGASVKGTPRPGTLGGSFALLATKSGNTLNDVKSDNFYKETSYCDTQDSVGLINLPTVSNVGTYYRIFGEYPLYQ